MEELVNLLSEKVGLSKKQARAAVDTVVGFLKERLPQPIGGFLDALLGKEGTLDQAGDVLGSLGGLLGGLGIQVPGQTGKPAPRPARPAPKKPTAAKPKPGKPAAKPAPKKPAAKKPAAGKPAAKRPAPKKPVSPKKPAPTATGGRPESGR